MAGYSGAGELVSSISTLLYFWIHKLLIQFFPLSKSGLECDLCFAVASGLAVMTLIRECKVGNTFEVW